MSRDEKVAYILENYPETRGNDRLCMLRYWEEFDGLRVQLGEDAWAVFFDLFKVEHPAKITHPETIRRGRQSVQKLRTGTGSLQPSGSVAEYRRARDGAGPPRR
jgi:hypothetical protein